MRYSYLIPTTYLFRQVFRGVYSNILVEDILNKLNIPIYRAEFEQLILVPITYYIFFVGFAR